MIDTHYWMMQMWCKLCCFWSLLSPTFETVELHGAKLTFKTTKTLSERMLQLLMPIVPSSWALFQFKGSIQPLPGRLKCQRCTEKIITLLSKLWSPPPQSAGASNQAGGINKTSGNQYKKIVFFPFFCLHKEYSPLSSLYYTKISSRQFMDIFLMKSKK